MDLVEFLSNIIKSPGPGGVIVISVIVMATIVYFFLTRWIIRGGEPDEDEEVFR